MATSTTCFKKPVIGRNYQYPGQTSSVIKFSIKSKKNNNVNLSSKTTSFWDKDGEKFLREQPVFVLSEICPSLGSPDKYFLSKCANNKIMMLS